MLFKAVSFLLSFCNFHLSENDSGNRQSLEIVFSLIISRHFDVKYICTDKSFSEKQLSSRELSRKHFILLRYNLISQII